MSRRTVILQSFSVLIGVSTSVGCAVRGTGGPEAMRLQQAPTPTRTRYSVTEQELSQADGSSVDDVVRRLRPEWLRVNPTLRQPSEPQRASVYLGNSYFGGLEVLTLFKVSEIRSIDYLTPMAARGRFGASCSCAAGVIVIRRREDASPEAQR
jgi:hypothetical protein